MMKTYHGRSDTKTFRIINYGNTIAGDSIYYRKNNVSKENFYKKYGLVCYYWPNDELKKLMWSYVKPCKGSTNLHVFYNHMTDSYCITEMSNVEEYHSAYEIKYHKK